MNKSHDKLRTAMAETTSACIVDPLLLRNGHKIPRLGFGTYLVGGDEVTRALKAGYRLIDTATCYDNEQSIGQAIRVSGLPREEVFVVTKVWDDEHGKEATVRALHTSLKKLGLDYIDLYLMHSPGGGNVLSTWDAMCELQRQGLTRSVGVANFNTEHLTELIKARPDNIPVVNQIEIHPFLSWDECLEVCQSKEIAVMAYSPLAKAEKLNNPTLKDLAHKYGRSPAQIMIRWSLQRGFVCIPRSSKEARIRENANVFDFEISEEDMKTLTALDVHYISDWPGIMKCAWDP